MLNKFFDPVEIDGYKFDKGMQLYEFDALREPEVTRFKKIGEFIRSRSEMVEIENPQMYWNGRYWPDLYISNRLDATRFGKPDGFRKWPLQTHPRFKSKWPNHMSLESASKEYHGTWFHMNFIEPMCLKISGKSSKEMSAKYHRSLWLPMYWPETLMDCKNLDTKFYYPKAGYAGEPLHGIPEAKKETETEVAYDKSTIRLSFVAGRPKEKFSVLFVADPSPIYRITDQDECSGSKGAIHRLVLESTGELDEADISKFVEDYKILGSKTISLTIPTIANVQKGWKPAPNMNDQLWSLIDGP